MTSKERPRTTIADLLNSLLTSHEYNDVTGVVTTNICDALFAIATAINRLADVEKQGLVEHARSVEARTVMFERVIAATNNGHDA